MTAEITFRENDYENSPILSKLTLITTGMTIFLAVLSLIFSNRLETLRVEYQDKIHDGFSTEATAELDAMKQSMEAEKAMTNKLRKKIAAITKESEKIKSDLALAQKTIAELRSAGTSTETMELSPFSDSPTSDSSPKVTSSDTDMESKDIVTEPEVQPSISPPSIQESTAPSLPEETIAPTSLPDEPVAPSTPESKPPAPSHNGTSTESNQTP